MKFLLCIVLAVGISVNLVDGNVPCPNGYFQTNALNCNPLLPCLSSSQTFFCNFFVYSNIGACCDAIAPSQSMIQCKGQGAYQLVDNSGNPVPCFNRCRKGFTCIGGTTPGFPNMCCPEN